MPRGPGSGPSRGRGPGLVPRPPPQPTHHRPRRLLYRWSSPRGRRLRCERRVGTELEDEAPGDERTHHIAHVFDITAAAERAVEIEQCADPFGRGRGRGGCGRCRE